MKSSADSCFSNSSIEPLVGGKTSFSHLVSPSILESLFGEMEFLDGLIPPLTADILTLEILALVLLILFEVRARLIFRPAIGVFKKPTFKDC